MRWDARVPLPYFRYRRGVLMRSSIPFSAVMVSSPEYYHAVVRSLSLNGLRCSIDAPHLLWDLSGEACARYQLICSYRQCIAFALAGGGWGRKWLAGISAPFAGLMWCMRSTGMQAWCARGEYLAACAGVRRIWQLPAHLALSRHVYVHHIGRHPPPRSFLIFSGLGINGQISSRKAGLYYAD